MKVDINIINEYVAKGLVDKNSHPTLPIAIYNYSREVQYEGKWDDITKMCRGLVLDGDGNVIAKSFKKFFNIEEGRYVPTENFEVYEKMDGSLLLVFWYQGQWVVASKGSFTSVQAIKGRELLKKYNTDIMFRHLTFCFELITKENRIVVDYGDYEGLVLLGTFDKNGKEYDVEMWRQYGFDVVKKYDGIKDYKQLKEMVKNNQKGFVVKFSKGDRMKIKGEEYVRLHRILTGFSNISIWVILKDGKDMNEFLERVPDEFDKWVKSVAMNLRYTHYSISERAGKMYDYFMYGKYNDKEPVTDRKVFAEWVLKQDKHLQPILFKMFDKKDYSSYIWSLIRPTYSKPFWQKEIES
jgi:RNA ligase